jgi:hypothetical protein
MIIEMKGERMEGWMDDDGYMGMMGMMFGPTLPNPESLSRVRPDSALSPLALTAGSIEEYLKAMLSAH